MRIKHLIILLIVLVLISGCAEKECKIDADCMEETCFTTACKNNISLGKSAIPPMN